MKIEMPDTVRFITGAAKMDYVPERVNVYLNKEGVCVDVDMG